MTCGIVLAGGASSRMGQPKALLPLGAVTMAERLVTLFEPFCQRIVIVTGMHHSEIVERLPNLRDRILYNQDHASGMFSSLRTGLDAVADANSVLFSPVDYAGVAPTSVTSLFECGEHVVVKPRWQGQSGHPVLIRHEAIQALRSAQTNSNAKQVLSGFPAHYVDVDDPAVAQDCDTPEDYTRLLAHFEEPA